MQRKSLQLEQLQFSIIIFIMILYDYNPVLLIIILYNYLSVFDIKSRTERLQP